MKKTAHGGWIATTARSLAPFRLYQPHSVAEVRAILRDAPAATLLAGGTDLAGQFNDGLQPQAVIELRRCTELTSIGATAEALHIGSGVTHLQGAHHPELQERLPGFAAAWRQIATVRIRHRATLGGNLMARRTRYELPVMLTALRADLHFGGGGAAATLPPEALWTAERSPASLLTHVTIPLGEDTLFAYDRSLRPVATLALALRRQGGSWHGHAALATEWLRPCLLPLPATASLAEVRRQSGALAAAAFEHLPADFEDCATPRWYLAQAGQALLARLMEGIANA
jgi:carbon-monoxide dehydrogenase medium subunit